MPGPFFFSFFFLKHMHFCSAFLACSGFSFKVEDNFRETFEQQPPSPSVPLN